MLEERFRKDTGEDWSKISSIPLIKIQGDYVREALVEFNNSSIELRTIDPKMYFIFFIFS